MYLHALLIVTG